MSLLAELKRRNVFRVAALYVVSGWLLMQVAEILFQALEVPPWGLRLVLGLLLLGFPPVLIFSWVFELTPEGIKREAEIDRSQSITPQTGHKLNIAIVVLLSAAVIFLALQHFRATEQDDASAAALLAVPPAQQPPPADEAGQSIAVLPFVNMSEDPANEYFSDGISEELLNVLVKVEGLTVASRTSSFAFKDKDVSVPDIAAQLKVDHVLEGSVRKAGNKVRITAQLIDVRSDRHIWSDTYDRELEDVFAIQDDISRRIVEALKVALGASEQAAIAHAQNPTDDLEAYELYLQGRYFWQRRGEDNIRKAIDLFTEATERDPAFARAWSSLAAAYITLPTYSNAPEAEAHPHAERAARRALELDDTLAEAYAVLGDLTRIDKRWKEAEGYYLAAIDHEPRDPTAHLWYGEFLFEVGRLKEALAANLTAHELDPLAPGSNINLAETYLALGQNEEALRYARTGWDLGHAWGKGQEGLIRLQRGEYAAAIEAFDAMEAAFGAPERVFGPVTEALQDPSGREATLRYLARVEAEAPAVVMWDVYALLNEVDKAYAVVDARFEELRANDWFNLWKVETTGMRADPRFPAILERLGLVDYWRTTAWPDACRPEGDGVVCR